MCAASRSEAITPRGRALFHLLTGIILSGVLCASARSADDQLWSETRYTLQLDDHFDLVAAGSLRLEDDFSRVGRVAGIFGFNWKPALWFVLTPTYQYSAHDDEDGPVAKVNTLSLLPTFRIPVSTATLSLSNAIEYRSRISDEDSWRFRPKVKLSQPLGPESFRLKVWLADELCYDTGAAAWTRNRLFVGFDKRLTSHLALELFYCRQQTMPMALPDLNIIGLNLRYRFNTPHETPDSDPDLP